MLSLTPKTAKEVPEALAQLTENSKIIGGGTDLIIKMKLGMCHPDALCYLGQIEDYKKITKEEDHVYIGAYATMTEIEQNPIIRREYPALMDAAADVGSLQIRNNGTIGGNIGNASPAGDLLPVLYLYHALIEITSPNGTERRPIDEVLAGPGRLSLGTNEAITGIILPPYEMISSFVKLGTRKKVTISRIGVALGLQMDGDYVKKMDLCIGAIAIKPIRLTEAENFIQGKVLNESNIMDIAKILSDYIYAHTPKEFDRDYKVFASRGVIMDAFLKLKRA